MSTGSLTHRDRSETNFRKRLLRSNSESKYRQLHKNSTMSSFRPKLERLLQQGKVEQILNTDPHSKANLFYTTHINSLEKQLEVAKKSLSTMVMKSKTKEFSINRLKSDIAKIEKDKNLLRNDSQFNKTLYSQNTDKFQKKRSQLEQVSWAQKCYQNMNYRLLYDEDCRKVQNDKKFSYVKEMNQQKKRLQTKYFNLCQTHKKLKEAVHTARQISKEQTDQKNQYIQLLNSQMAEKDLIEDIRQQKKGRDHKINEISGSLIEQEELKRYLQILFTHKIVSSIIKCKNKKLMKKYSKVERGFMHIKSNTNISEVHKILDRMEKQDQQYENLLKKVSQLEKQLGNTDQQMDKVIQKKYKILSRDGDKEYVSNPLSHYNGIHKDQYEIKVYQKNKLIEQKNRDEILKKQVVLWANSYGKNFNINVDAKTEEDFLTQLEALSKAINAQISKQ